MDLRVKKTLNSINEAFFQLKKRKPIEKISVKELSEMAMINKATFYLHYESIYDLSDKLESKLIAEIIDEVRVSDLRFGREEFKAFAENLIKSIIAHSKEIKILFSGYDNNRFINHLEDSLKNYIFRSFPNIPNNNEINIIFTLFIHGSFHAFIRNPSINPEILTATTSSLFLKLIDV